MVKPLQPSRSRRPIRKLRTVGVCLAPEVFAEFQALAMADQRTLSFLGGLAILEFLARRRTAAMPQQGTLPERSS